METALKYICKRCGRPITDDRQYVFCSKECYRKYYSKQGYVQRMVLVDAVSGRKHDKIRYERVEHYPVLDCFALFYKDRKIGLFENKFWRIEKT